MYSDPIADMLTRIRNGYMAKKEFVIVPHSKMKAAIANVLVEEGYLKAVTVKEENNKKDLEIALQYINGKPAITRVVRISKAGRQVYKNKKSLPYVLSGLGKSIISTSQGIMTANQARKKSLGGEVVCNVW